MRVVIIGLGGIGSCLIEPLTKFLHFGYPETELVLVDGDSYEHRNLERQMFEKLANKAEETLRRLSLTYDNLRYRAVPEFIGDENIYSLIRKDDIVLMGVDNHATRKLVSDRVSELQNGVLISGGNELTNGSVQAFIRQEGKNITHPLTMFHSEISDPQDVNPADAGCEQLVASENQLVFMNLMVASAMLNVLYSHLTHEVKYDIVYVDMKTNVATPVFRSNDPAAMAVP